MLDEEVKSKRSIRKSIKDYFTKLIGYIKLCSLWCCIILGISLLLLGLAIFSFVIYYENTMPNVFTVKQPLYFDYEHPNSIIPIDNENNINIHYHITSEEFIIPKNNRHTIPTAIFSLPNHFLDSRVAYSFTIHFKFADSPLNRQIGMFMVRLNIKNQDNDILVSTNRPVMIPYRSTLHKFIRMIVLLIPSLLGLYEETYEITIPCIEYYWDDPLDSLNSIEITLSHPDIQLYSSTLFISTQLFGIPYALHHYFIATFVIIICIFFILEWLSLISCIGFYYVKYAQTETKKQLKRNLYPVPQSKKYDILRKESAVDIPLDKIRKDTGLPIQSIGVGDEELTVEISSDENIPNDDTDLLSIDSSNSKNNNPKLEDVIIIKEDNNDKPLRKRNIKNDKLEVPDNIDELLKSKE